MTRYILLLGGNLGDPGKALAMARCHIAAQVGRIVSESSEMWTSPVGNGVTRDFLNQALIVETEMDPEQLLDSLENIERKMGRDKPACTRWNIEDRVYSDRIIDIDIEYADFSCCGRFDGRWNSERLSIPHRAADKRDYVARLVSELEL